MPQLRNIRQEAFANYRARGCSLEEAYEMAGFVRDSGHACRLARRPRVAARIVEVRAELGNAAPRANLEQTIAGLLALVDRGDFYNTPQHLAEARVTLLEAHRLHDVWTQFRAKERESVAGSRTNPAKTLPVSLPDSCHFLPSGVGGGGG